MELFEAKEEEKKKLLEVSNECEAEIEREIARILDKSGNFIASTLIITGSLVLGYSLINGLGRKKNKKIKKKTETTSNLEGDSLFSQIGSTVASYSMLLILDIAREKLVQYIESKKVEKQA